MGINSASGRQQIACANPDINKKQNHLNRGISMIDPWSRTNPVVFSGEKEGKK
jgi:hypothetical protein